MQDVNFLRVATACPPVDVGNVAKNIQNIGRLYKSCVNKRVSLVVFPEMSLTGYTLGDLVQQDILLKAAKAGLLELAKQTSKTQTAMVVGLPLPVGNTLYNCAALISGGKVRGIVPKTHLPNYKEFYEQRWYQTWPGDNTEIIIGNQTVPFGTKLLFKVGTGLVGIEICEDLWVTNPPSVVLAGAGATVIANPSASPEQLTKGDYRRQLVNLQSARLAAAYLYAGCDASESTTDIVMGGHQIIAENGVVLAERQPLTLGQEMLIADVDLDHLAHDRRKDTNFPNLSLPVIDCQIAPQQKDLMRTVDPYPFIPKEYQAAHRLQQILNIQAQALATRLKNTGVHTMVLGLSGGLDSTLALLVAVLAAERLGKKPQSIIQTITMPGQASSAHTQTNAAKLAAAFGIPNHTIPISKLAAAQLSALDHDGQTEDITYENVQARTRTALLFNRANQVGGMVLGTGDLSEIALGWCTYNGDHMSHYNVNASIPKTLVKHLVAHAAAQHPDNVRKILQSILDTPISPELTGGQNGKISQHTEALIGPYELHDFFLYHFVRWGDTPRKIEFLAGQAFAGKYKPAEIRKWLDVFIKRFMQNQWKRSVATDGPKVGSVSLSPRGDWRMPSDISGQLWLS